MDDAVVVEKRQRREERGEHSAKVHVRRHGGVNATPPRGLLAAVEARLAEVAVGCEVDAVDGLHREKCTGGVLPELEKAHEVGMVQALDGAKFGFETEKRDAARILDPLSRDELSAHAIEDEVDRPHPAATELAFETVPFARPLALEARKAIAALGPDRQRSSVCARPRSSCRWRRGMPADSAARATLPP